MLKNNVKKQLSYDSHNNSNDINNCCIFILKKIAKVQSKARNKENMVLQFTSLEICLEYTIY